MSDDEYINFGDRKGKRKPKREPIILSDEEDDVIPPSIIGAEFGYQEPPPEQMTPPPGEGDRFPRNYQAASRETRNKIDLLGAGDRNLGLQRLNEERMARALGTYDDDEELRPINLFIPEEPKNNSSNYNQPSNSTRNPLREKLTTGI